MIYQLKRKSSNLEMISGIIISVCSLAFLGYYFLILQGTEPAFWMILAFPYLLYFSMRRFLTSIIFDFDAETISTISILPTIKREIHFAQIERISLLGATNLKKSVGVRSGFQVKNLSVKTRGNIQTQIFTIKSEAEYATVNKIMAAWEKTKSI